MAVREANEHDVNTRAELVGSLAHFYLEDCSQPLPDWFADSIKPAAFRSRIEIQDYLTLVYEAAGGINGYISIKSGSHQYHLSVREESQGQGIARLSDVWLLNSGASRIQGRHRLSTDGIRL